MTKGPPKAPDQFNAEPDTGTSIMLTWQPGSDDTTGYTIYDQQGNVLHEASASETSYTVTGLTNSYLSGTAAAYSFAIRAYSGPSNARQYSFRAYADSLTGFLSGGNAPATAPSNFTASAGSDPPSQQQGTINFLSFTWIDTTADETGFLIEYQDPSSGAWQLAGSQGGINGTNGGGIVNSNGILPLPATTFNFRIRAYNQYGFSPAAAATAISCNYYDVTPPTDLKVQESATPGVWDVTFTPPSTSSPNYVEDVTSTPADRIEYLNVPSPDVEWISNGHWRLSGMTSGVTYSVVASVSGAGGPGEAPYRETQPVYFTLAGGQVRPTVSIRATKPQTAEGGSEKGQFKLYREGTDNSQKLDVAVTLATGSGMASENTDFKPISRTITFQPGSSEAVVEVEALADTNQNEGNELVRLTVTDGGTSYHAGNTKQATVTILDKRKFLYAFYGSGNVLSFGNQWFQRIADKASFAKGYIEKLDTENHLDAGIADILSKLDADQNRTISKAEAESGEMRALGWSWGGLQAINFANALSHTNESLFHLDAQIRFEKLLALDPVNNYAFLKSARQAVQSNVKNFSEFYQRRSVDTSITEITPAGNVNHPVSTNIQLGPIQLPLRGSFIQSNAPVNNYSQVEINDPGLEQHVYAFKADGKTPDTDGFIRGDQVNHAALVWWAYTRALDYLN